MKDIYEHILEMLESGETHADILAYFKNSAQSQDILKMLDAMNLDEIYPDKAILRNAIAATNTASVTQTGGDRYIAVAGRDICASSKKSNLGSFFNFLTHTLMQKRLIFVGTGVATFFVIVAVGAYMMRGLYFLPIDQNLVFQIEENADLTQYFEDVDSFLIEDIDFENDMLLLAALDAPVDIENLDTELESDINALIGNFEDLDSFDEDIDPELDELLS
ncbi:MAG: hypothetical protein HYV41_05135 [Candidatus Magasanikbacteria bacterium]|nr:hypothetical protein [Candidatus Magasanikbacteria bacterium]